MDAFLSFLEQHGDVVGSYLECETLGRFAASSRRCLAMTHQGSFLVRWKVAADALDQVFPLTPDREAGGKDPRLLLVDDDDDEDAGRNEEELKKMILAKWHGTHPMKRVARMLAWQRSVAEAVRACPDDYGECFGFYQRDERFDGFYDFSGDGRNYDGSRCSPALCLVVRLAYVKCCAYDRCYEDACRSTHANDVHENGWDEADWYSSSRRDFHSNILTSALADDDDDDGDGYGKEETGPVVTKERVLWLCEDESGLVEDLAPFVGTRAATLLTINRGTADLPATWESLFDDTHPRSRASSTSSSSSW